MFNFLYHVLVAARGIQLPDQVLNPRPPALGARSLSHWMTGEVPKISFPTVNLRVRKKLKKETKVF